MNLKTKMIIWDKRLTPAVKVVTRGPEDDRRYTNSAGCAFGAIEKGNKMTRVVHLQHLIDTMYYWDKIDWMEIQTALEPLAEWKHCELPVNI